MHGAAYVGFRPCHHKHSYSTNPSGFIVYRKLKTWLCLLSILGWNMWTVFCFVQQKQSKHASNQSYKSELFSSLINTNKHVIAHHCCLQDLVEGVNRRSELFLFRTWSFSCHWDEWEGLFTWHYGLGWQIMSFFWPHLYDTIIRWWFIWLVISTKLRNFPHNLPPKENKAW
jgi:hypothetical protein